MSRIVAVVVTVIALVVFALYFGLTALDLLLAPLITVVVAAVVYRFALGRHAQHRNQAAAQRRRI